MDFASILSSEISKSKRKTPSAPADAPPKKYLKRSEIEAQRLAAYAAEQKALEDARTAKAEAKAEAAAAELARVEGIKERQRQLAEERHARENARLGITAAPDAAAAEKDDTPEIPDEEVKQRLRELGLPRILFGEEVPQRYRRLQRAEQRRRKSVSPPPVVMSEEEMKIDAKDIKADPEKVYLQLSAWFRLVMLEWRRALAARPETVKDSIPGRKAADAMRQADEYMKPLFLHFKNRDLKPLVYEKICEIVIEAQARRYVRANDVYLRLSIGNAAWPIGVTMVGIHERSAREKLHENQKEGGAHIMSDEVTRKFLQSIKRCLSFCQTRWPPEDPLQLMG